MRLTVTLLLCVLAVAWCIPAPPTPFPQEGKVFNALLDTPSGHGILDVCHIPNGVTGRRSIVVMHIDSYLAFTGLSRWGDDTNITASDAYVLVLLDSRIMQVDHVYTIEFNDTLTYTPSGACSFREGGEVEVVLYVENGFTKPVIREWPDGTVLEQNRFFTGTTSEPTVAHLSFFYDVSRDVLRMRSSEYQLLSDSTWVDAKVDVVSFQSEVEVQGQKPSETWILVEAESAGARRVDVFQLLEITREEQNLVTVTEQRSASFEIGVFCGGMSSFSDYHGPQIRWTEAFSDYVYIPLSMTGGQIDAFVAMAYTPMTAGAPLSSSILRIDRATFEVALVEFAVPPSLKATPLGAYALFASDASPEHSSLAMQFAEVDCATGDFHSGHGTEVDLAALEPLFDAFVFGITHQTFTIDNFAAEIFVGATGAGIMWAPSASSVRVISMMVAARGASVTGFSDISLGPNDYQVSTWVRDGGGAGDWSAVRQSFGTGTSVDQLYWLYPFGGSNYAVTGQSSIGGDFFGFGGLSAGVFLQCPNTCHFCEFGECAYDDTFDSFVCDCVLGYDGPHCEHSLSSCESNANCNGNGYCLGLNKCLCLPPFFGYACEHEMPNITSAVEQDVSHFASFNVNDIQRVVSTVESQYWYIIGHLDAGQSITLQSGLVASAPETAIYVAQMLEDEQAPVRVSFIYADSSTAENAVRLGDVVFVNSVPGVAVAGTWGGRNVNLNCITHYLSGESRLKSATLNALTVPGIGRVDFLAIITMEGHFQRVVSSVEPDLALGGANACHGTSSLCEADEERLLLSTSSLLNGLMVYSVCLQETIVDVCYSYVVYVNAPLYGGGVPPLDMQLLGQFESPNDLPLSTLELIPSVVGTIYDPVVLLHSHYHPSVTFNAAPASIHSADGKFLSNANSTGEVTVAFFVDRVDMDVARVSSFTYGGSYRFSPPSSAFTLEPTHAIDNIDGSNALGVQYQDSTLFHSVGLWYFDRRSFVRSDEFAHRPRVPFFLGLPNMHGVFVNSVLRLRRVGTTLVHDTTVLLLELPGDVAFHVTIVQQEYNSQDPKNYVRRANTQADTVSIHVQQRGGLVVWYKDDMIATYVFPFNGTLSDISANSDGDLYIAGDALDDIIPGTTGTVNGPVAWRMRGTDCNEYGVSQKHFNPLLPCDCTAGPDAPENGCTGGPLESDAVDEAVKWVFPIDDETRFNFNVTDPATQYHVSVGEHGEEKIPLLLTHIPTDLDDAGDYGGEVVVLEDEGGVPRRTVSGLQWSFDLVSRDKRGVPAPEDNTARRFSSPVVTDLIQVNEHTYVAAVHRGLADEVTFSRRVPGDTFVHEVISLQDDGPSYIMVIDASQPRFPTVLLKPVHPTRSNYLDEDHHFLYEGNSFPLFLEGTRLERTASGFYLQSLVAVDPPGSPSSFDFLTVNIRKFEDVVLDDTLSFVWEFEPIITCTAPTPGFPRCRLDAVCFDVFEDAGGDDLVRIHMTMTDVAEISIPGVISSFPLTPAPYALTAGEVLPCGGPSPSSLPFSLDPSAPACPHRILFDPLLDYTTYHPEFTGVGLQWQEISLGVVSRIVVSVVNDIGIGECTVLDISAPTYAPPFPSGDPGTLTFSLDHDMGTTSLSVKNLPDCGFTQARVRVDLFVNGVESAVLESGYMRDHAPSTLQITLNGRVGFLESLQIQDESLMRSPDTVCEFGQDVDSFFVSTRSVTPDLWSDDFAIAKYPRAGSAESLFALRGESQNVYNFNFLPESADSPSRYTVRNDITSMDSGVFGEDSVIATAYNSFGGFANAALFADESDLQGSAIFSSSDHLSSPAYTIFSSESGANEINAILRTRLGRRRITSVKVEGTDIYVASTGSECLVGNVILPEGYAVICIDGEELLSVPTPTALPTPTATPVPPPPVPTPTTAPGPMATTVPMPPQVPPPPTPLPTPTSVPGNPTSPTPPGGGEGDDSGLIDNPPTVGDTGNTPPGPVVVDPPVPVDPLATPAPVNIGGVTVEIPVPADPTKPVVIAVTTADGSETVVASVSFAGNEQLVDILVIVGPGDPLETAAANAATSSEVVSQVLDISLSNGQSELGGNALVCLQVPEGVDESDACLAFINSNLRWQCEDECLDRNGDMVCGTTTHFTSFAVLFGGVGGDGCDGDDAYITGSWWGDVILTGATFVSVCCGIIVMTFIACRVPQTRRIIRGEASAAELERYTRDLRERELESLEASSGSSSGTQGDF